MRVKWDVMKKCTVMWKVLETLEFLIINGHEMRKSTGMDCIVMWIVMVSFCVWFECH